GLGPWWHRQALAPLWRGRPFVVGQRLHTCARVVWTFTSFPVFSGVGFRGHSDASSVCHLACFCCRPQWDSCCHLIGGRRGPARGGWGVRRGGVRGWAVGAFVPELSSASEVPVNRQWGVCLSVLLQGRTIDFVDVNESNARWVQDFRLKAYASPAKLESIDGARYHALLIPSCPGALADLASSGSLARILQHFRSESKPICAVGHGVAALCCATNEDRSWVFQGYSVTGPSVYELVRAPGFARLPLIVEDFVKDAGANFSASEPDAVHVVLDRHLVTGQNASSTVPAVQNLLFLCGSRK
uniref:Glutamine amidotransferase-like class 1 domain-containing protein 1 n=1 Tax=Lynx canadensis TaxID=61383 RepID=A0A667HUJ1_LYNCA